MSHHVCVWIDHRDARIFEIALSGPAEGKGGVTVGGETVKLAAHLHHRNPGDANGVLDRGDLAAIAARLATARGILIAGPGRARNELAGYLSEHHPEVAKHIWAIEPMDHPSDPQIVAAARRYFEAAVHMRT